MELRAQDLRIGNILNYDTAEGDVLPTTIDWQDLKWISEDAKGFNICHSPIPLTEEILLKCGIRWKDGFYNITDEIRICSDTYNVYAEQDNNILLWIGVECKHLHTIQNLYFALTGTELNVSL